MAKFDWVGESGKVYEYEEYRIDGPWADTPGNYIFVSVTSETRRRALYIGQTNSFKNRGMPNHEKLPCVRQYGGGTYVHAHVNADEQARLAEETDLVRRHHPPCNG